ncbi:lipase chaperone [Confluentibacter citreus]|uniref:lipase chaperone n=1 Tax=Confluentibacter citreus TaxID=2007307 RepID=UPI000C29147A|nr:lipase chaperone [Confluentibacter citreus]
MAQDIRDLFKEEGIQHETMSKNHQEKFLEKLDKALPISNKRHFNWLQVAASIVVLLGLSFGAFNYFKTMPSSTNTTVAETQPMVVKTLGDVSPGLKKVEDYYLASINLELSKMAYTPETKDMFDGYLEQLEGLDKEYQRLSVELTELGPNELTVNALIDNLKLRLNLLYRLRSQLQDLPDDVEDTSKSI